MMKATITSKGQVTLPKAVRERLKLEAGDKLIFEVEGDTLQAQVEHTPTVNALFERFAGADDAHEAEDAAMKNALVRKHLGQR